MPLTTYLTWFLSLFLRPVIMPANRQGYLAVGSERILAGEEID